MTRGMLARFVGVLGIAGLLAPAALLDAAPAAAATDCRRGYVALTFDDGPDGTHTPAVLDALRRWGVPATFFVIGSRVNHRPDLVRRQAREGHAVANHSWGHVDMTRQTDAQIRDTILRTERRIASAGARPTKLVRPPYGATNARVLAAIRSVGHQQMLWTIDPQDWRPGRSHSTISSFVLSRLHRNAVILLHDGLRNSPNTVRALPAIIDGTRSLGYCFGLLDDRGAVVPAAAPAPAAPPPPVTPEWLLRGALSGGAADVQFRYGSGGDVTLLCDWNGDGVSTPGVFRGGVWHLRNRVGGGAADASFSYGRAGDVPVCGDWNGDGGDTVGVFRGGVWHLRNANSGGGAHVSFSYGRTGDVPVVGDWAGDGVDTVGVFRGGVWHLRNRLAGGGADASFVFGRSGDAPVVGDWTGDGVDTVGVFRSGAWHLRNAFAGGAADRTFQYGRAGDRPLPADWNGDGRVGAAVTR